MVRTSVSIPRAATARFRVHPPRSGRSPGPRSTGLGLLDCRNPLLAAHQFMGILNEFSLWPWMMGRQDLPAAEDALIEEAVAMFLARYQPTKSEGATGKSAGKRQAANKR
jgi:hypothetical protein